MDKSSEPQKTAKDQPQANNGKRESKPAVKGWPFAPGSQLAQQIARPWTPKPSYRFNQR